MPKQKTFKADINPANPALNFISQPEQTSASINKPPAGYKINPLYIETKSRRLQLLVQPSLYDKLKEKAVKEGISINELANTLMANELDKEKQYE